VEATANSQYAFKPFLASGIGMGKAIAIDRPTDFMRSCVSKFSYGIHIFESGLVNCDRCTMSGVLFLRAFPWWTPLRIETSGWLGGEKWTLFKPLSKWIE
jgi:hypothetical protein